MKATSAYPECRALRTLNGTRYVPGVPAIGSVAAGGKAAQLCSRKPAGCRCRRKYTVEATTILTSTAPDSKRGTTTDPRGTTSYLYDEAGLLSDLAYPDGRRLSYAYDAVGRLAKLAAHVGLNAHETHYSYLTTSRVESGRLQTPWGESTPTPTTKLETWYR